jgi:hypothetical protein
MNPGPGVKLLAFYCCDKIPELFNLKCVKIYFGSWFQSVALWCLSFGPVVR